MEKEKSILSDEQQQKIEAIRKKAKRGREKGYHHSEATKEKIGEGVSRGKERKTEIESCCKQTERNLSLEEALEKAIEKFQYCRYADHKAPSGEEFKVEAYYERGEEIRYYAMEQKIEGIENTIPAAKKLLADEIVSHIMIKIVASEKEVGEDGVTRMKFKKDPAHVVVAKEDEEGKSYMVWYMDEAIMREWES